jgi:hypothetical protein
MTLEYCDTSPIVIDKMIAKLENNPHALLSMSVLEPSAGRGAIIKKLPVAEFVSFCELNMKKASTIRDETGAHFLDWDFLKLSEYFTFDRIVAVPPFDLEQWLVHTKKMYKHLRKDGKMVVLLPVEAIKSNDFMNWIMSLYGTIEFIKECACDYRCDTFILEINKQD